MSVTVFLKKPLGVRHPKVLKVEQTVGIIFPHELHKFIYEIVVCFSAHAFLLPALYTTINYSQAGYECEQLTT